MHSFNNETQLGAVISFIAKLEEHHHPESTTKPYFYNLMVLVKNNIDLFNPQCYIDFILKYNNTESRKYNINKAYKSFLNAYGIKANLPKFNPKPKARYLPPEEYIDQLIASCNSKMAVLTQFLKETAVRPIEAMRVKIEDIDFANSIVQINHPAKDCNSRNIPISEKLSIMIKNLQRKDGEKIFIYKNERSAGRTFRVMRKRAAHKLGIKDINKIKMPTFRYWRGTVEYQENGEGATMVLLGHTSTRYIYVYVQLAKVYFGGQPKKYQTVWVHNREEETKAAQEGYDLVRTDPKDGASLYRRADRSKAVSIGHD